MAEAARAPMLRIRILSSFFEVRNLHRRRMGGAPTSACRLRRHRPKRRPAGLAVRAGPAASARSQRREAIIRKHMKAGDSE